MNINSISSTYQANGVKAPKSVRNVSSTQRAASVTVASDTVQISGGARAAQAQKIVSKAPDIRREKVEAAKKKLASGELFTDEAIGKMADKLINKYFS